MNTLVTFRSNSPTTMQLIVSGLIDPSLKFSTSVDLWNGNIMVASQVSRSDTALHMYALMSVKSWNPLSNLT